MTAWLFWLLVSGSLIIAEMFTLSFYLLLAGIGALVACGLAATGFNDVTQVLAAALVTLLGWFMLQKYKPQNAHPDHRTNPDLNMDIGATVRIASVAPDGKLSVMLRGARWDAQIEDGSAPDTTKDYTISKIDGSTLILKQKSYGDIL